MSGTEYQKTKEDAAAIMREKQRKGEFRNSTVIETTHSDPFALQPMRKGKPKQAEKRNNPDAPIPIYLTLSSSELNGLI